MSALPTDLRNQLERTIIAARDAAEAGARAALEALAAHHHEPYPHMDPEQRALRNKLRARARQMGDRQDPSGRLAINHLVGECAYEHWHRMLFARFLAENNLLIEPEMGVPISLSEAEELAKEDGLDVWEFASLCAQSMLPQIFRPDDPLLQVSLATEHRIKLERLLNSLPQASFTASDALGWVYQFWQSKKKEEVKRSEVKIGADELPAVTQLFTEPYMVEFLLHNTIGAWWAGKKMVENPTWAEEAQSEDELRRKLALPGVSWDYLRFVRGADGNGGPWRPAAGTFEGWPKAAKDIKSLDPCCGSGHFLVAALRHLVPIRMAEEGLSTAEAVDAVLRDNLHGLEIDERCCQIAAFALAFAAWTFPNLPSLIGRGARGEGTSLGHRSLPELHIACSGIAPNTIKEHWLKLAEEIAAKGGMPAKRDLFDIEHSLLSASVKNTLEALYELFSQAPVLGSLINPANIRTDLFHAEYATVEPLLSAVLKAQTVNDEIYESAIAAAGMVKAADLLADEFHLIITNVPYLGRNAHTVPMEEYANAHFRLARDNLATIFVARSIHLLTRSGVLAAVTPHNWLFQTRYSAFRKTMLESICWKLFAKLGPSAFETIGGAVVNVALLVLTNAQPNDEVLMSGLTAIRVSGPLAKAAVLKGAVVNSSSPSDATPPQESNSEEERSEDNGRLDHLSPGEIMVLKQSQQLLHPDARLILSRDLTGSLLQEHAYSAQGIGTTDNPRFVLRFWEVQYLPAGWEFFQTAAQDSSSFSGYSSVFAWGGPGSDYFQHIEALKREKRIGGGWQAGSIAWGREGFSVNVTGNKLVTQYSGAKFDTTVGAIIVMKPSNLAAIGAFLESPDYVAALQKIDNALSVTEATLVKVPFDLRHWQKVAAKKYPQGLPEKESDDPTQWLFHGLHEDSTTPLQVAVARLLGYRWPAELDEKMHLSKRARELVKRSEDLLPFADDDGIVCIPSVRGEEPAADRLMAIIAACGIKTGRVRELTGGADLDDWLRNSFFEEHCKLFHYRPFIWHIWDGRKHDGFHVLVNYHKLAEGDGKGRKLLETLTYSCLGEWVTRQKDGVKHGEGGAEDRLAAALELQKRLKAILEGKPPFDIFVRWKPLHQQPIGWEPDINEGVRLNIRPFLASDLPNGKKGAGILRCKPNIKWGKDRGKEPKRPKAAYPWFWGWDEKTMDFMGGREFDGNRWNDCHYTNMAKQAAHHAAKVREGKG